MLDLFIIPGPFDMSQRVSALTPDVATPGVRADRMPKRENSRPLIRRCNTLTSKILHLTNANQV